MNHKNDELNNLFEKSKTIIQAAREIRRNLGDEVPILLISAYDWSEFEAEAREAGISGFISKPLFKSTLYHALCQYMDV